MKCWIIHGRGLQIRMHNRKINIAISEPKHMLWVLKRTVSMRRFFWAPITKAKIDLKGNNYTLTIEILPYGSVIMFVLACETVCAAEIWKVLEQSKYRIARKNGQIKVSKKIIFFSVEKVNDSAHELSAKKFFFLSCVCYAFVRVCLFVPCGHLLGKGWPLGSRLWCLTVCLSLFHWYPGLGVVLDCIDSWSLHPYLLCKYLAKF